MKSEIEWAGQKYLMEWLDDTDFENLDNVVQSYGFVFDEEGRLCIVDCSNGYWCLPGGKPEDCDESFEDTLIREVDEEADLDIKNIRRIGCFRVTPLGENCERKVHHILRYVAEVDRIREQTIDPCNGKIGLRKFVGADEFCDYVDWGENGAFQLEKALAVLAREKL